MAERDGGDGARQRGVAGRELRVRGAALEHLLERGPAAKDVGDDGPGEPPSVKTLNRLGRIDVSVRLGQTLSPKGRGARGPRPRGSLRRRPGTLPWVWWARRQTPKPRQAPARRRCGSRSQDESRRGCPCRAR